MNAMFAFELARRQAGTAITVNCVHPGIIPGTGLSREVPGLDALVSQAFRDGVLPSSGPQPRGPGAPRFTGSQDAPGPDVGADTPAWLATAPEVGGVTGRFFLDREPVETAPHITDPARWERLWHESARLTGLAA
jgi:NAD(P)-dependent dehydrogenase (short-subunit alcohol dehydrogenase family)